MEGRSVRQLFEEQAGRYDRWYEMPAGRILFEAELEALRAISAGLPGPRLEIGVGTGRFADPLGVDVGVDLAYGVLSLYRLRRRGAGAAAGAVHLLQADGARLPFTPATIGTAFLIVSLCFAADPLRLVEEAARVVRPGGAVVAALIDRESAWGRWYLEKKAAGHLFYRHARFFSAAEVQHWLEASGLRVTRFASTLLQPPGDDPRPEAPVEGLVPGAGFVCLAGVK